MDNNRPWTRKVIIMFSLLVNFISFVPVVSAEEKNDGTVDAFSANIIEQTNLEVNAAVAIDQKTGQFLFKYNDNELQGIASLTKLISLYVIYDKISSGELTLETKIPISAAVSELSRKSELSNVPLDVSADQYTVEMLIDAIIISSANAAVVAVAEFIAGSEQNFVSMMKDKLAELGINHYQIYTASGLSGEYLTGANPFTLDDENKMQARDILFVAHQLVEDYPEIIERSQATSKPFAVNNQETVNLINTNEFIEGMPYARNDVFGLKTGTEDFAGSCIIVISYIDERPIMLVTLGAEDNESRFIQTGNLLDALQNNLEWNVLAEEEEVWLETDAINVYQGRSENTSLAHGSTNAIFLPKGYSEEGFIQTHYDQAWQYGANGKIVVNAPLETGQIINTYEMKIPFIEPLFDEIEVKNAIIATEDIEKVNSLIQVARIMADMFSTWVYRLNEFTERL